MSSRVLSPHYKCPHHFSSTHDDKVKLMIVALNLASHASGMFYLKKTLEDDSLQFIKVFPATVLCYMVICMYSCLLHTS